MATYQSKAPTVSYQSKAPAVSYQSKAPAPAVKTTSNVSTSPGSYKGVAINAGNQSSIQAQMKSIDSKASSNTRNTSVNSTNMSDATASLPPPPPPIKTSDVGANNAGLVEGLPGYTYQDGAFTQTTTDTTGATTPLADQVSSYLKSQKDFVGTPPSAEKIYQQSGAAERDTAKQLVNTYTGQLNTIVANRDASNLALTGQGRGIPEAIIGGQQAQISKEAAITALPIQALLANAQGNYELAQTHLDETFKIRMADATSQYQYRSDLYKSVYDIADKAQQRQLDAKQKTADQNFTLYKDFINFNRDAYKDFGINAGSALAKLPTLDTSDPNFMQNFSDQQSEASKIYSKFAVSKSEANTEGTINGKPQNVSQSAANSYANRLNESNVVLNNLGGKFTGKLAIGEYLPNALQSGDRQAYEQSKSNFVTAVLRRESGASISPTEFDTAEKQYFPQAGDKPETVAQKEVSRNTVINNFYREANVVRPVLPGDIVQSGGKRYKVGLDGQTIEELK